MSLTNDDKQWIAETLAQKLEELETRMLRAFRNLSHPVERRDAEEGNGRKEHGEK